MNASRKTLVLALFMTGLVGPQAIREAPRASDARQVGPASHPLVDSARAEFDAGRYWHASRLLRTEPDLQGPAQVLLLARADAGWKNWTAVVEALEEAAWLDELEGGEGRRLLALGLENAGRWAEAAASFARFREDAPRGRPIAPEASREARAAARADRWESVLVALEAVGAESRSLAGWTALEVAGPMADEGRVAHVVELLPWIRRDSAAWAAAWETEARARLASGDSAGALDAYLRRLESGLGSARRGAALARIGELRLARRDTAEARIAFLASLEVQSVGASAARAAQGVLRTGPLDAPTVRLAAETLDRVGESPGALTAYRRYLVERPDSVGPEPEVGLAVARLLSLTGQHEAAVSDFRVLAETDDASFELRLLDQWLRARRRQGRDDAVRTIQGWIVDRFPESVQAVDIVFSRAATAQDNGRRAEAIAGFQRALAMAPSLSSAGQARMRLGQIYLLENDPASAAGVFRGYLEDFPDGQRWEEAAYWAARSLQALGRESEGRPYLEMIRAQSPVSYYGALVAEQLGEPFAPPVPGGPVSDPPEWLRSGLSTLDVLTAAGLDEGSRAQVAYLLKRADGSVPASLDLADGLIERGFTIDGINVGWKLRREGSPYSRRLLGVLYPFPYREIVTREAKEAGIEPFLLASLIRQESAFAPGIRSSAGAIGLMQVMPATGRELARGQGIGGFTPLSLETAEINLHLGTTFWVDMERRYGHGNLPLALSAYNAGPTRARRWGRLPEAEDPLRFTERIPFDETRGYVKNITRNLHVYRFLYGDD